ncbi:MAG TPA: pyridoxamine 5'-phosphate oxidase family protein [Geobacteraceae bacterium]|nr:pyridoxamine 5'-phosphate oxidase family protein [Geobacteraceae bacterium]
MITEIMKTFIEQIDLAYVASSDKSGRPHMAAVKGLTIPDPRHIVFSEWFCPKTIENISANPEIAIAVMDPETGKGYQLAGIVEKTMDIGILDGYDPGIEKPETPQVLYQLAIRVVEIMEFTHGVHTDRPMG